MGKRGVTPAELLEELGRYYDVAVVYDAELAASIRPTKELEHLGLFGLAISRERNRLLFWAVSERGYEAVVDVEPGGTVLDPEKICSSQLMRSLRTTFGVKPREDRSLLGTLAQIYGKGAR